MNKPKNSIIINVCVIPDERVSAECVALSQSLKSEDTLFVLDGNNFFAHMTAYMARFPIDRINELVNGVNAALQPIKPFRCEHTGYFMTAGRYLEASYRRSDDFMLLHESLINHLSGLRINPGNPYEEGYFTPYTPEQKQNARETGYDLARNLYRPHVTLTRYREDHVPQAFPAFATANLTFNLGKVCVFKADDNGAVYELVQEFTVAG